MVAMTKAHLAAFDAARFIAFAAVTAVPLSDRQASKRMDERAEFAALLNEVQDFIKEAAK